MHELGRAVPVGYTTLPYDVTTGLLIKTFTVFIRENRESLHHVKISHYTVHSCHEVYTADFISVRTLLTLLQQMEKLGLNPYLLRWIRSYLSGRTQHVVVDGCSSQTLPIISGVPQGSVLGPLLFICYINDVASVTSEGSDMSLFADDIALYRVIKSPADYNVLQDDINSVSKVISDKYLCFNKTKCKTMLITRKHSISCQPPPLRLDGTILAQVSSYKYLGITITSDLSWSPHIHHISNKARRLVGLLYRHFYKHSNSHTLLKLYLSYVRPHLEYCSHVWSPSLKGDIDIVEAVKKYALRVCMKSWELNYDDLLNTTSISPLHKRRKIACLCHLYEIFNGLIEFPDAPVHPKNFSYHSRSANSSYLCAPKCRTSSHQHSFFPKTIAAWNNLPANIRNCDSYQAFKSNVTKYLE